MKRKITMLGTGHATVTECYNTCFIIENDGEKLLVDAGGGNGILKQFRSAGEAFVDIHNMLITHSHTDHLLGAVWVIRKIVALMFEKSYSGELCIYCDKKSGALLRHICRETLFEGYLPYYNERVFFTALKDGESFSAANADITVFDVRSQSLEQLGFTASFADGAKLCCFGDEPIHPQCEQLAKGCDLLLTEAYCLYSQRDIFHPYDKRHSTVTDAAKKAAELSARSLLLYHGEDSDLASRKQRYTAEAEKYFTGKIYVPNDLDIIEF